MTYIHQTSISYSDSSAPKVWRIGKYIRLSRDDGNSESESITNQRKILDEQIAACFDGSCFVTDEYIDDGRTGTSDDTRPEFHHASDQRCKKRTNQLHCHQKPFPCIQKQRQPRKILRRVYSLVQHPLYLPL